MNHTKTDPNQLNEPKSLGTPQETVMFTKEELQMTAPNHSLEKERASCEDDKHPAPQNTSANQARSPHTHRKESAMNPSLPVKPMSTKPIVVFMVLGAVLAFVADPKCRRWVDHLGKTPQAIHMGVVTWTQPIQRFGPTGTLITLGDRKLQVLGVADVSPGTTMEWWPGRWGADLCVLGTQKCWEVLEGDTGERAGPT